MSAFTPRALVGIAAVSLVIVTGQSDQVQAQTIITGSGAQYAGGTLKLPSQHAGRLGDVLGSREVTLGQTGVTLDGARNEVRVDVAGLTAAFDLDSGDGWLGADLTVLEIVVRRRRARSSQVVRVGGGEFTAEFELFFESGMGAITGSAAAETTEPVGYIATINTPLGRRRVVSGEDLDVRTVEGPSDGSARALADEAGGAGGGSKSGSSSFVGVPLRVNRGSDMYDFEVQLSDGILRFSVSLADLNSLNPGSRLLDAVRGCSLQGCPEDRPQVRIEAVGCLRMSDGFSCTEITGAERLEAPRSPLLTSHTDCPNGFGPLTFQSDEGANDLTLRLIGDRYDPRSEQRESFELEKQLTNDGCFNPTTRQIDLTASADWGITYSADGEWFPTPTVFLVATGDRFDAYHGKITKRVAAFRRSSLFQRRAVREAYEAHLADQIIEIVTYYDPEKRDLMAREGLSEEAVSYLVQGRSGIPLFCQADLLCLSLDEEATGGWVIGGAHAAEAGFYLGPTFVGLPVSIQSPAPTTALLDTRYAAISEQRRTSLRKEFEILGPQGVAAREVELFDRFGADLYVVLAKLMLEASAEGARQIAGHWRFAWTLANAGDPGLLDPLREMISRTRQQRATIEEQYGADYYRMIMTAFRRALEENAR